MDEEVINNQEKLTELEKTVEDLKNYNNDNKK